MTLDNIGEREMDRLCWLLVSTRNRFYPPYETAEECIEHFEQEAEENDDVAYPDDETRGDEHGYHRGMFTANDMFMEQLYGYGINVLARANRYTYANRQHDMEFRLDDEPDFYQHIERGAEDKAENSTLFEDIEIEDIDREDPPYVPRGAESDE